MRISARSTSRGASACPRSVCVGSKTTTRTLRSLATCRLYDVCAFFFFLKHHVSTLTHQLFPLLVSVPGIPNVLALYHLYHFVKLEEGSPTHRQCACSRLGFCLAFSPTQCPLVHPLSIYKCVDLHPLVVIVMCVACRRVYISWKRLTHSQRIKHKRKSD